MLRTTKIRFHTGFPRCIGAEDSSRGAFRRGGWFSHPPPEGAVPLTEKKNYSLRVSKLNVTGVPPLQGTS